MRIVKLGGSLLDLPDLAARLGTWLARQSPEPTALIVGGGPLADWVRQADATHRLGQALAHQLALRALQTPAALVSVLTGWPVVTTWPLENVGVAVLDPWAWLGLWESDPAREQLPHTWDVTSDSIAAFVAVQSRAAELVLLKSHLPPGVRTPEEAAAEGLVDPWFPNLADRVGPIRLVNFRSPEFAERWLTTP